MNWYLLLRLLHIVSAMLFIGGVGARQVLRSFANTTHDIRTFVVLNHAGGRIETGMVMPGFLGVIVFGVLLALTTRTPMAGLLQGGSQNWLLVSLLLLGVDLLTMPVVNRQRGKLFDDMVQEAVAIGHMTPQLRAELTNSTIRWMYCTQLVVPVVIVVLMVLKPF